MKVTCKVCHTTKNIKDKKLIPYRGKVISTKCANKECTNRIKFKVPIDIDEKRAEKLVEKKEDKNGGKTIETSSLDTVKCPQCANLISKDIRYCTSCGFEINIPKKRNVTKKKIVSYCKKCGNELEGDEKFCPKCGKYVDENSEEKITKKIVKTSPENHIKKQGKETIKKTVDKPIDKKTEKQISSPIQSLPIQKRSKKRKSFLKIIFKIILWLVLLAVIGFVILFIIMMNEDKTLKDGPWQMEAYRTETLFSGAGNRSKSKWNNAVRRVNLEYKSYLDSTKISAPKAVTYNTNTVDFYVERYNPVNKGNLYYFTVPEPNGNGKMNVVLDLKSKDYFEAKAFFISDNEISIGYLKGKLKESK